MKLSTEMTCNANSDICICMCACVHVCMCACVHVCMCAYWLSLSYLRYMRVIAACGCHVWVGHLCILAYNGIDFSNSNLHYI